MTSWFHDAIVAPGRLPLFFLLVAFVLTFAFIRFSVRMIRAEVSWWPGNVTPGGVHVHHEFFGFIAMLIAGFFFVALANFHTPIANCVLAALFGIGAALVLDEFALILHLRDVYWEEEGRSSIDAVFVAVAVGLLFLMGLRPLEFSEAMSELQSSNDVATRITVVLSIAINVVLAIITLLKGKLWTGLIGMFIPVLLLVGAIRIARPRSPWARWRYVEHPGKQAKSAERERRYREPLMRWKVVAQEAVAGRFGVPDTVAPAVVDPAVGFSERKAPNRIASAIRWRRTRRQLVHKPPWRLAFIAVSLAIVAGIVASVVDDDFGTRRLNPGATATLLGVIAGAMATLTGLVFTAITLAMQFGASQISVRVIPLLQNDKVMRWSIAVFLSTFVFTVLVAVDLATSDSNDGAPGISTAIAIVMTLISAFMLVLVIGRVGSVLNSSQLLRWVESQGRIAIRRNYPDEPSPAGSRRTDGDRVLAVEADADPEADAPAASMRITVRDRPTHGRVLLAMNLMGIQRLAIRWNVRIDVLVGIGDHIPQNAAVFEIHGDPRSVRPPQLLACLLFGDTHRPEVSPAAALQTISDIALKALSPAINDPSRAVQAIDHIENMLSMLAPRMLLDEQSAELDLIRGYRRSWADFVSIGTDQLREYGADSIQVQRRLRALLENLIEQCPPEQHPPLTERIDALDAEIVRHWHNPLDRRLASASDVQGLGSESGRSRVGRLAINPTAERGPSESDDPRSPR